MTTTTTPAVDVNVWGHTPALRDAQAAVAAATAAGDPEAIAAAARALIVAAAAHGWPTATALVFKYERTGRVAHLWGLWRVVDVDGRVLCEWEDEPGDMTDESEEELIALDLITNRAATLHATDYGTPTGTAATVLHPHTLLAWLGATPTGPARTRGRPPRPPSNPGPCVPSARLQPCPLVALLSRSAAH
jgi:hypothetical protein